jgi:hypothetical protein
MVDITEALEDARFWSACDSISCDASSASLTQAGMVVEMLVATVCAIVALVSKIGIMIKMTIHQNKEDRQALVPFSLPNGLEQDMGAPTTG